MLKDVRGIPLKIGQEVIYSKRAYGYGITIHFGHILTLPEKGEENHIMAKIMGDKGKTIHRRVNEILVMPQLEGEVS